jgi:hypothetical protein
MRREVISFTLKSVKPRDIVAQAMLDRDGPYRAKRVAKAVEYQRKPKHRNRIEE